MKIAVVGASGLVGGSLFEELLRFFPGADVIGTYHTHPFDKGMALDITRQEEIGRFMEVFTPDVVIWLAGSKNLTQLEGNPQLGYLLNEMPVIDLLKVLEGSPKSEKLIYISSDYVFDGQSGSYRSTDRPSPDTVYGKTKAFAEDRILESTVEAVCLRTAAIMNPRGGFMGWLLNQLRSDRVVSLYSNTIFSPTASSSFNRAICRIIERSLWGGVLHFAGPAMSRYDFGRLVVGLLGKDISCIRPDLADIEHSTFHKDLSLITSDELIDLVPDERELKDELSRND